MAARSEYPDGPEAGSPVFADGGSLLDNAAVHFVDRPRGADPAPKDVFGLLAPERVASVLQLGALRAFQVYNSGLSKAVCVSDISGAELEGAFRFGLNSRGKVPPWAVVLNRKSLWERGFRPVLYTEPSKTDEFRRACAEVHGDGWGALVVTTDPSDNGRNDGPHERESRHCFAPEDPHPQVDVQGLFRAVIVEEKDWVPKGWIVPAAFGNAPRHGVNFTVRRWLWDRKTKRLVHDGQLVIERKERPA